MIAELDISSEKAEDTLNHQEEIQTFNNNLFNPNSKPQSTPNQSLPIEDHSPLIQESQRMPNQESTDVYQVGEYDDTQKDTLDLNYQAEIQAQQDNQVGSSSQTGRLEDLLKDADMALRRSQHLAAVLNEDSSNQVKYQNQYGDSFPGQNQQVNSVGSSNGQRIMEYSQKYTNKTNYATTDPFQDNQNDFNRVVYGSETNPIWNEVSQGQPQSIESWKSNANSESRFLDKSYGAKLKAAYDLFPIQEAMESGTETPRESNRSSVNNLNNFAFAQFRSENPSDKLKAYNFTQTTSLVDQVLKNPSDTKGYGGVTPAFRPTEQMNVSIKPTWETVTKSTIRTEDPYMQSTEQKKDEGHLSNRSYKTEMPDPFFDAKQTTSKYELDLTKEGMDKKIDEILKKHFGGNNEADAFSNTNLRLSQTSNKQPNWKYSLPEHNTNIDPYRPSLSIGGSFKDDSHLPRDSASIDTFGNPFYSANAPRQTGITQTVKTVESAYLNSPGNPLLTLASPTSSTQNKFSYKIPDNVLSERGTTDLRFSQDQFLKAEPEYMKRSANYADIQSFSSPQGTFRNQYSDQNAKSNFKFTSPLLQKYSNPFVEDYFHKNGAPKRASPGERQNKFEEERINPAKERELQSRPFNSDLRDFDHKIVESKEQSPEKGHPENNPYFFSSQNIYSPPISNRTAENDFVKANAQVIPSDAKSKSSGAPTLSYPAYRAQDLQEDQHIENFDDPFEDELGSGEGIPKTQFESLKQYQPNPSENIEEDFEKMNMMFDHVNAFYGHPEVQSPLEEDKMEFPESTPGKYTDFLNSDRRFEAGHEMAPGHETTPDKKLKKLTFKNRLSEERHHNERPEENGHDKINERDLALESKQRKKIFDDKAFEHDKQLQEEVFNSERVLREMEKDNEKNKRVIFSEMPKRKDIEILMEPLQEEARNAHTEENKPNSDRGSKTQTTPREQKNNNFSNRDLEGRRDSERFPFQLKNGVMDPTESFFDFENENFLTNEDYVKQQISQKIIDKPSIQGGLKFNPETIQPLSKPQETTRRKGNVSGKIWILDVSNVENESVDLANPQSISQNLKKVPVLKHCFEKFRHITDNFPHA